MILGSASPDIVKNVSETLAGRVEFVELSPFDLAEVGAEHWRSLWVRGGFPRAFLAASDEDSAAWREGFIRNLDHLWVLHPGPHTYPVHEKLTVCAITDVSGLADRIRS